VAFRQGQLGNAAIVAAQVTAPPVASILNVPKGWIKPSQAVISWQPAESADGPLAYHLVLDGHPLAAPAGKREMRLDPSGLGSGRHHVQVLATDVDGQSTLSAPATLLIDGVPPTAKIARAIGGRAVSVRVLDRYAGVDARAVRVSFGDGHGAGGRVRYLHRYAHPGVYRVTALVRDRLGNLGVVRQWVGVQ
jgi:hypothetical protein